MIKAKALLLSLVTVAATIQIAISNCHAAEQAEEPKPVKEQINQRLENQYLRLIDIEELARIRRQYIEDRYIYDLNCLYRLAQDHAVRLRLLDRLLWVEFIKMNNQIPYADGYFENESVSLLTYSLDEKALMLRSAMLDSYFLNTATTLLMDKDAYDLLTAIEDSDNQNFLIRRKARKLLVIMDELKLALTRLQTRRNISLADLDKWEMDQKENVYAAIRDIEAHAGLPQSGVVIAISYSPKETFAMVGGEIVYPQSVINNVTVTEINRYKVHFAKNHERWTQTIGDPANSAWTK